MNKHLKYIMVAAIAMAACWFWGYHSRPENDTPPTIIRDTIIRVSNSAGEIRLIDSLRLANDSLIALKSEVKTLVKTIYIPQLDTITEVEYIQLPREQRHYTHDSLAEIWVSGYQPRLDSLWLYQNEHVQIINKVMKTKPHFAVGLQLGYGVSIKETPSFAPFVGVGVTYNLWSF